MNINNYKELSNFINDETEKFTDIYGIKLVSNDVINAFNKNIKNYSNLYSGYLFRKEKRQVMLQEAIETMPHNWLWKIFHSKLWRQIKAIKDEQDKIKHEEEIRQKMLNEQQKQEVVINQEPVTAVVVVKEEPKE